MLTGHAGLRWTVGVMIGGAIIYVHEFDAGVGCC